MEDTFVRLVSNLGFPIAVASFVLFRLNGKVQKLADAMTKLADALRGHTEQSKQQTDGIERRLEALEREKHFRKSGGC